LQWHEHAVFAFILDRRLNAVSIRAALSAAIALSVVSTGTAQAELFWPHYRSWGWDDYGPVRPHHYRSWGWGDYEPFRQKRRRANKGYELEQKPKSLEVVKGPLQIIISIADQKISVYDDGTLIARSSVSTGVQGHPTPLGVFSIIGKELWHRSNIYSAAPMPYMQRITWSGIALHAGVLPGHPASHGCIRLAKDFAIRLWHLTKRGTRVIIAPNNVDPVQIASPRLFSEPKTASSSQDTTNPLAGKDVLTIPSTPPALAPNAQSQKDTNLLPTTGVVQQKKGAPISVFVSRKLSRLFVRQRFTPLFDVPIKVETPERPLGTHLFTLLELQNEGAKFRWNVVSIPETLSNISPSSNKTPNAPVQGTSETVRSNPSPEDANAALDRIEIPPDVVARISQILTPGSSLIVSDYGLSRETGNDTDFIVVMP
jgi:lipoprotein-anchoring transpeptidase ErfK/SrfK